MKINSKKELIKENGALLNNSIIRIKFLISFFKYYVLLFFYFFEFLKKKNTFSHTQRLKIHYFGYVYLNQAIIKN